VTEPRSRKPPEQRLLSLEEAANYCGVSIGLFKERFTITPIAVGRRRLYDRHDLDRFIDSLKGAAPASASDWLDRFDERAA
jgi:hypothetical protein